jgi:riboflavin synthase
VFTGIIEELGTVRSLVSGSAGARLQVRCRTVLQDSPEGASIAVNGVCLTAVDLRPDSFSADLAPETLSRSNLGRLRPGSSVNLERPLAPSGRLSGHIVQGHVDGTGEFLSLESLGEDNWWLRIRVPPELDPYLVFKGSIAIDGISLTVAALEADVLSVTIIPHTYRHTTLGGYRPGDLVNLECDILAKHVEKLLRKLDLQSPLTIEKLKENGY